MKKLIIFIAIVALLVGGAFLFLTGGALNDLIKAKIEEVGLQVTDQAVSVKSVDVKLFEGAGTINGLVIPNPKKYRASSAFSLNEVTLDINLESLTTDLIIIDKIIINKPEAVVEFTKTGGSNIKDLLDAINKNLPASGTEKKAAPTTSDQAEPIIRVNEFVLADVALTVDLTEPSKELSKELGKDLADKVYKSTLADIHLTNIGGNNGMPASQLGGELMKQALASIWKQAKKEQKKQLKNKVENKVKDKLKGFLDKF
jgi:hypothetical protein